jgi:UDP:flavonoid glycosyltransferase YjiC (YdhE family)
VARVVVASCMYLGDVAPYVEPANRLVDRGHDVTFLAPAGFHELLGNERFELVTYPLDASPSAMHADPKHERLMRHPFLNFGRLGAYWMGKGFAEDPEAARGSLLDAFAGADVVVVHPTFGSAAVPVAEHLGIPTVVGQLFPMMIPTRQWLPSMFPGPASVGRPLNRAAWRAFAAVSGPMMGDRTLNRHREVLGRPRLRGNALRGWTSATRTVLLFDREYFGRTADDWERVTWGGFSPWAGPSRPLDPAVERFLDDGDPPVLVCLGTSAASGAGQAFARIAADLDRQGLRSLLLVGDPANLRALEDRPGAFAFAPVTQVLPRCRAAVVSGSLGTLAASLTAGVPVVVVPQLFDQLWHGRRVEQLGVGRLAWRARSVARDVAAIEADPGCAQRASALGSRLAAADGAAALVDAVESVVRRSSGDP